MKSIYFLHGPSTGILPVILEHIVSFNQWYAMMLEAYPDELFTERVLTFGKAVEHDGAPLMQPRTGEEARDVDALVSAFFLEFEQRRRLLAYASESTVPTHRYEDTQPWLSQHTPPPVHQLWTYLVKGRGIGRDNAVLPYVPADPYDAEAIGFWTLGEVEYLHTALSPLLPLTDDRSMYVWNVWYALDAARARQTGLILVSV